MKINEFLGLKNVVDHLKVDQSALYEQVEILEKRMGVLTYKSKIES